MAPPPDPRKNVGARVHALAWDFTAHAECARRYGANKKTKKVPGVVVSIQNVMSGQRASCYLTSDYNLGGATMKRIELNLRRVTAGDLSTPAPPVASHIEQGEGRAAPSDVEENCADRHPRGSAYSGQTALNLVPASYDPAEVVAHGTKWVCNDCQEDLQASVPFKAWSIVSASGECLGPGSDISGHSPLDYFLMMFPPSQLRSMVEMTNARLLSSRLLVISSGELLKFFGILILSTRVEFGSRASLWSGIKPGKYIQAPSFGSTGMARKKFDSLWRYVRFSAQPTKRPPSMSSENYRSLLVDDFVQRFNANRVTNINPSDLVCVDESMSRWYGKGGFWITAGLPQYISIDRKPENGCEIQNSACGRSHIMMRLKLVKTAEAEDAMRVEDSAGVPHGALILKQLVEPWKMTGRIVCADSYFASVFAAQYLMAAGLRFIGIVRTGARRFPMTALSQVELQRRGDRHGLTCMDEDGPPKLLAFVWMDRNRRYFVSSCSSLVPGALYSRMRWWQLQHVESNEDPQLLELEVPQPKAAEIYYRVCGAIDHHNRCQQDTLNLEKKLGTMDWSMRVSMTIFGMCVVDTWKAFSGCQGNRCTLTQDEFYVRLAEDIIDNKLDTINFRRRAPDAELSQAMAGGVAQSGVGVHLTPTKRRRKSKTGEVWTYLLQGRCRICDSKTTQVCSECRKTSPNESEVWLCGTRKGATCFPQHMAHAHNL